MTNVILITADQLRADALRCYGNGAARTPNLDGLAARGCRLLNHFTPNQICSPSRATLFSGLFARRHGLVCNGIALDPDSELIAHALARAGYRTHGVGKFHFQPILAAAELRMPDSNAFWGLPESQHWQGPFYGFETADILIGESAAATEGGHYARWLETVAPGAQRLYRRENALAPPPGDLDEVWKCAIPEQLHYNRWIAERACAFLDQLDGESFFLFVSFPDPHHPFAPPAPWCDLIAPSSVPLPRVVAGELDRMPDYVSADLFGAEGADDGRKSYLDFLLSPGRPREQGFMGETRGISEATMRLLIAHTYGSVGMVDACIGRIVAKLSERRLLDDTIVMFTADHGELLGDHGLLRKGPPPYKQVLQVPFIVAGPRIEAAAHAALTSHVDVKATLMDLLELAGDGGDGASFAPILRGERTETQDALFAEYHPRVTREQYNQTIITNEWRLTLYPERRDWGELFDRRRDPGEHNNLFHQTEHARTRDELAARLGKDWPPAPNAGGKRLATY